MLANIAFSAVLVIDTICVLEIFSALIAFFIMIVTAVITYPTDITIIIGNPIYAIIWVVTFAIFAERVMFVKTVLADLGSVAIVIVDGVRFVAGITVFATVAKESLMVSTASASKTVAVFGFLSAGDAKSGSANNEVVKVFGMVFSDADDRVEFLVVPISITAELAVSVDSYAFVVVIVFASVPKVNGVFATRNFTLY